MADVAEQPTAVETPEAPVAAPTDFSLADHEAAFGAVPPALKGDERAEFEEKREKIRHRAKSQQATPDDVKAINEWTARAKAAEDAAGIARNDGESERVYRLRVRAELAEAAKTRPASPPAVAATPSVPAASREQPANVQPWAMQGFTPTRPEPKADDIGVKYALYEDFTRDQSAWVWEQNNAYQQAVQQQQSIQNVQRKAWDDAHASYRTKAQQFAATHPDFDTKIQESIRAHGGALNLPDPAYHAIVGGDNGPAFMYHLATHPDQLAEVVAMWDGKPPTPTNVALATSWLNTRAQAATTGSAAPTTPRNAPPPPPNPVRSGATKAADTLPGDDSSISAHERAFGPKRR